MKTQKLALGVIASGVVYLGVALLGLTQTDSHAATHHYTKTSVDDTSLFIYTDITTQCKYIYNATTREIHTAKGSETCVVPASFEE